MVRFFLSLVGILYAFNIECAVTPNLFISNKEAILENAWPIFYIESTEICDKLAWEISQEEDFSNPSNQLEGVQEFTHALIPNVFETASLVPETPYFIRTKGRYAEIWGEWSEPFCFQLSKPLTLKGYERSPYVDEEVWNSVSGFFLPEDHPIKPALDKIFSKSRVTVNKKSVKKSGFEDIIEGQYSHIIVAKHRKLHGYVIKLYTDETTGINEWSQYKKRILGALQLKNSIEKHGYAKFFKVPKKWIYPLPVNPAPPDNTARKNFILIAEDMDICPDSVNEGQWRGQLVTKELLDALFTILQENGVMDGAMPENIPFSKDGKNAFIDTECCNIWPVRYRRLNKYLSNKMLTHWKSLYHN